VTLLSFAIKSSKKIEKQIKHLDGKMKRRLFELFLELKINPVPAGSYDVAKVSGFPNRYRIRIGPIRVIYDVEWKEKLIELFRIERKKDRTYKF